jgi:hypothetical protein
MKNLLLLRFPSQQISGRCIQIVFRVCLKSTPSLYLRDNIPNHEKKYRN